MNSVDIDSILALSYLDVPEDQKKTFSNQIRRILDYMSVLNKVDCESADSRLETPMVARDDSPVVFEHALVKENAPDYRPEGFAVPKIL
jgi:aspartyl/glutamyl-tRNA(Asn/Gln) amidotransferase C subunit